DVRLRGDSDLPDGRLRAGRPHRRSVSDVPVGLLHRADAARRDPGDLDSRRAREARGRRQGAAGRLSDRRTGVQRLGNARRGLRPGAGDRVPRRPGRSESGVRQTMILSEEEVRDAVQDALDSLPPEIASRLTNVAVLVEDAHPSGRLKGLFDPRGGLQRIIVYRQYHRSAEDVRQTVLHEIGHYFGADERTVRAWGL